MREEPFHRSLQNPSDALLILARAAEDGDEEVLGEGGPANSTPRDASCTVDAILSPVQQKRYDQIHSLESAGGQIPAIQAIEEYPPVKEGAVNVQTLYQLLQ